MQLQMFQVAFRYVSWIEYSWCWRSSGRCDLDLIRGLAGKAIPLYMHPPDSCASALSAMANFFKLMFLIVATLRFALRREKIWTAV
jgi:hypothetical protein